MTIQEMRELKKEYGFNYEQIAVGSNLPVSTIQKIFGGTTKSPRRDTIERLTRFFEHVKDEKKPFTYQPPKCPEQPQWLKESSTYHVKKKQQGEYTMEDYHLFPDEHRVELIDGVVIEMEGPHYVHQLIAGEVFRQISNYLKEKKGKCLPGIAPMDVQLDKDNKTIVQPDVMIVCDRDKWLNGRIYGAPDWVMEILSKSTRSKDCIKKLNKYMDAGVREYWIADPERQAVTVYDFEHENFPMNYAFEDQIPIGISSGELKIDMTETKEYIEML